MADVIGLTLAGLTTLLGLALTSWWAVRAGNNALKAASVRVGDPTLWEDNAGREIHGRIIKRTWKWVYVLLEDLTNRNQAVLVFTKSGPFSQGKRGFPQPYDLTDPLAIEEMKRYGVTSEDIDRLRKKARARGRES